jgi:hypothetical protein
LPPWPEIRPSRECPTCCSFQEAKLIRRSSPPTEVAEINEDAEAISEKLSLLTFELPDPEQDLTVQYPGVAATTFTCFSELALEIRLIIWRAAFPKGRKVVLKVQWGKKQILWASTPCHSENQQGEYDRDQEKLSTVFPRC